MRLPADLQTVYLQSEAVGIMAPEATVYNCAATQITVLHSVFQRTCGTGMGMPASTSSDC